MAIYQNKPIKSLSEDVFFLDVGDFAILHKFAIKGESTRHSILTTQDKKTVSKKIDILYKKGFLILRKSTPFRGQPHKSTKFFGLSLKGFLASLHFCNVEDNYLTKKFLKVIKNKKQSTLILHYLKDDLIFFFSYNSIRGITLDKMRNISDWLDAYEILSGFSDEEKKYLKTLDDNRRDAWNKLEKFITKKPNIGIFIQNWYYYLDDFVNGMNYSQIIENIHAQDVPRGLWDKISDQSSKRNFEKILEKYKPT